MCGDFGCQATGNEVRKQHGAKEAGIGQDRPNALRVDTSHLCLRVLVAWRVPSPSGRLADYGQAAQDEAEHPESAACIKQVLDSQRHRTKIQEA